MFLLCGSDVIKALKDSFNRDIPRGSFVDNALKGSFEDSVNDTGLAQELKEA